ncbi:MAG: polymorphic toxin type 50 domain-containing protein [Propionicimonas sp.]
MSKPRSRLIGKTDSEFRTLRGYTTAIHFGKQAKHLPGQPNYDSSKSTITISIQELQRLVELKSGTGIRRGTYREVVDFGTVIGLHRDGPKAPGSPTTRGTIHYSKTGAHVVPAEPNPPKKKGRRS